MNKELKEIYKALSAPFPEEAVERTDKSVTRKGYNTTGIKYQYIINRLNEVLTPFGWGYEILDESSVEKTTNKGIPMTEVTVVVSVWLKAGDLITEKISMPGGHTSFTYADAKKGAYTNALKKAFAMFGVGKEAYEGSIDDDSQPLPEGYKTATVVRNSAFPASQKQINLLRKLLKENGISEEEYCKSYQINSLEEVEKMKASRSIEKLMNKEKTVSADDEAGFEHIAESLN